MEAENKPQLDPAVFSKLMSAATGSEPEPDSPVRDPKHLSPPPDPAEPGEDSDEGGAAAAVADEAQREADPYQRFSDVVGSEAADALREINEPMPTPDEAAALIRHVYADKFPALQDNATVAEVLLEAESVINELNAQGDQGPDLDVAHILQLAVMRVVAPEDAADEALKRILDGERHLVAAQTRDRTEHARKRRQRAEQLLNQKKEANHADQVLNAILDRDHLKLSTLTGGRGIGESHRDTGTGRNLGMMGT